MKFIKHIKIIILFLTGVLLIQPVFGQAIVQSNDSSIVVIGDFPDRVIVPGETITFRLLFENKGTESISITSNEIIIGAHLTVDYVYRAKKSLGAVEPGGSRLLEIPITISGTAPSGVHSVSVRTEYTIDKQLSRTEKTFTFTVGSRTGLYLENILLDPLESEAGDIVKVTVLLKNVGFDEVKQVFAKLDPQTSDITPHLGNGEAFTSVISVGETKPLEFSLSIGSSVERGNYVADLTLEFEDPVGESQTDNFSIGIPVYGVPKIEVLGTEIDSGVYKIELENLGNAKALAIRAKLVQGSEILDVDVDNELKPDKQSTMRFTNYRQGSAILSLNYLDEYDNEYVDEVPLSISASSVESWKSPNAIIAVLIVVILIESFYIYQLREK